MYVLCYWNDLSTTTMIKIRYLAARMCGPRNSYGLLNAGSRQLSRVLIHNTAGKT